MVNKQYNVQNSNKNKAKNHNQTAAINQCITAISNVINPNQQTISANNNNNNNSLRANDNHQTKSAFEKNITQQYYNDSIDTFDLVDGNRSRDNNNISSNIVDHNNGNVKSNIITSTDNSLSASNESNSHTHLSINDIGRFQYILQMDREMVSYF